MANTASETRNKDGRRRYGCDGKRRYPSWSAAERIAKDVRKRKGSGAVLAPYRCKACSGFHLAAVDDLERSRLRQDRGARRGAK